jgi:hypothetical protein
MKDDGLDYKGQKLLELLDEVKSGKWCSDPNVNKCKISANYRAEYENATVYECLTCGKAWALEVVHKGSRGYYDIDGNFNYEREIYGWVPATKREHKVVSRPGFWRRVMNGMDI